MPTITNQETIDQSKIVSLRERIDNLKYLTWQSFWYRKKTNAYKAVKLLNMLKKELLNCQDEAFIHKINILFNWLEQPENTNLWKPLRGSRPGERCTAEYLVFMPAPTRKIVCPVKIGNL